jgi:hypothetical protein
VNVSPADGGTVSINNGPPITDYSKPLIFAETTLLLQAEPNPGYDFVNWTGAVTGSAKSVYLYLNCEKTVTANFALSNPEMSELYFPHVASQIGSSPDIWETEVCVINTGNQPLSGTLKSYRNTVFGWAATSSTPIDLAAHGRWSRIVGQGEFTNPSEIGYMVFESASNSVVGYTKFYKAGQYRAAIPAVKEGNASDIPIPHIASDAVWWTGISLVNTTSVQKNLTLTFDNGDSRPITLGSREHKVYNIAEDFFGNQTQPDIRSAVISGADGIIGLELFATYDGKEMEGIPLTDRTANTLFYPHVTHDDQWTGVVAYNPSDAACGITIRPYSAQGGTLATMIDSIAGKERYVGTVEDLDLPAQAAWFRIDSAVQPLSGFELIGTSGGSRLAAYAAGGRTSATGGVLPKIEKEGSTDIGFVNTEATEASVTLTAFDDNGTPKATETLHIVGYAQEIKHPKDIFTQDISNATYIVFSSDKQVVGFQLNGSADGTMLDGMPALVATP